LSRQELRSLLASGCWFDEMGANSFAWVGAHGSASSVWCSGTEVRDPLDKQCFAWAKERVCSIYLILLFPPLSRIFVLCRLDTVTDFILRFCQPQTRARVETGAITTAVVLVHVRVLPRQGHRPPYLKPVFDFLRHWRLSVRRCA
jgi:hypothetical protein